MAGPALAQPARSSQKTSVPTIESFRAQYDVMMSNFERIAVAMGDTAAQERVRQGRDAMQAVTNDQLAALYARTRIPDLSVAAAASEYVASRLGSGGGPVTRSLPFPDAPALIGECIGPTIPLDSTGRFALLILKEIASSILAAATFVCTQDILGENASFPCIAFAIASDIANGFFDVAQYCAGEFTANQVDGSFNRLAHIHDDLTAGIKTIVNNDNSNKTAIINNDKAIKDAIINNDNANKDSIINNDKAIKDAIINNDNANKNAIINAILASCVR